MKKDPHNQTQESGYYQIHAFVCLNHRENYINCAQQGSEALFHHFKERLKELKLHKAGCVRVNSAGCMGRCKSGPVIVIYPQGVWYRCSSKDEIDRIIDEHILNNQIVKDLRLTDFVAQSSSGTDSSV